VTVTINALPGAPSAGNVIACFDGARHTGSATAGAGESVVWYTLRLAASDHSTVRHSGWNLHCVCGGQDAATGCESATRTYVTVTINDLPGAPSAGNVIACFDGVRIPAVRQRALGERGLVRRRDRRQCDHAPTGTAVGIYTAYAAAKIAATGCESGTRTT
jgi:hypothetical protein